MLLTLSASAKPDFSFKPPHDSSPLFSSSSVRSPPPKVTDASFRARQASDAGAMSAPHRGLPPPAAMTLPDPSRGSDRGLPPSNPQWPGQMPAPPPQWQGAEESMRNWLVARAEEDKRKQEEEKTRQENLRLEQRKIEQAMLRDTMQAGVPPHLIPVVFAGISGTNIGFEVLQNYYAHMQASLPQFQAAPQPQGSPDARRDSRLLSQPQTGAFGPAPPPPAPPQGPPPAAVLPGQPVGTQRPFPTTPVPPSGRPRAHTTGHAGAPTSAPRPPPGQSTLPRLTTNEMHIVPPPTAQHPLHQSQTAQTMQQEQQQQPSSSPSIYFHHWVPPTSQAGSGTGNAPGTPSEFTNSPKKRKAQGGHQAAPPPSSSAQQTSPSFSQASSSASTPARRGHGRARSDASMRAFDGSTRPTSHPGSGATGAGSSRGGRESSAEGGGATSSAEMQHAQYPHPQRRPQEQSRARASSLAEPREGAGTNTGAVGRNNYEFVAGAQHETRQQQHAASSAPASPGRESGGGGGGGGGRQAQPAQPR